MYVYHVSDFPRHSEIRYCSNKQQTTTDRQLLLSFLILIEWQLADHDQLADLNQHADGLEMIEDIENKPGDANKQNFRLDRGKRFALRFLSKSATVSITVFHICL